MIMPVFPRQIRSHLVVLLGFLQDRHVHVHHAHALVARFQLAQRPHKRHGHLAQPGVAPCSRTARVDEDDGARVLEGPTHDRRVEEEGLGSGVPAEAGGRAVVQGPWWRVSMSVMVGGKGVRDGEHHTESWDDDDLGAVGYELAEGFGEGKVPA